MSSRTAVIAWGSGEDGQLGIGDNEEHEWVCSIKALQSEKVCSVVAGSRNSLAICENGKLFTWGWNQRGTLGHPPETKTENDPSQVKALSNVKIVQAAIGGWHCLAVDDQGRAYAWGGNEYGQCGEEPERKDDSGKPVRRDIVIPQRCVPKLSVSQSIIPQLSAQCAPSSSMEPEIHYFLALGEVAVIQCNSGRSSWVIQRPESAALCFKHRSYAAYIRPPVPRNGQEPLRHWGNVVVVGVCVFDSKVAAGGTHSVVLTKEGHVWTWGQPWPPGDIKQISTPVRVQGLASVRLIAAGAFHNLALLDDGVLMAWGNNEYGQLGTGDTQPRSQPISVQGLSCVSLVDIAAGGWHSAALTEEGEVYGWGRGEHGRLGFGDDKSSKMVPQRVQLLSGENVVQISCGGTHSVALTRDGRMFSFGRGDHGRLGYGRKVTTGHPSQVPINIPPPRDLTESAGLWCAKFVACGGRHTLAIVEWRPTIQPEQI